MCSGALHPCSTSRRRLHAFWAWSCRASRGRRFRRSWNSGSHPHRFRGTCRTYATAPTCSPQEIPMSDSTIRLRSATAADADSISALLTDLGHTTKSADIPSRLAAVLNDRGTVLLAVDGGDRPLGLISLACLRAIHAAGPIGQITALVTAS